MKSLSTDDSLKQVVIIIHVTLMIMIVIMIVFSNR